MGIQVKWFDEEQGVLHIAFENNWTLDDFRHIITVGSEKIQSKSHIVHVFADFRDSQTPSSAGLIAVPFAIRHWQANQGAIIVLSENEMIKQLAKTAASMHQRLSHGLYIVHSVEYARRIIAHFDKQKQIVV